jgi:hypothetical protein
MSLRVESTRVIAGSRLKCVEPPGLGHNRGTNHCRLDSESCKCLILKRRDAGAVDQARLESDAVERRTDVRKHCFRSRFNDLAPGTCFPVFPRK